jgi:dipeptidyl aminopeptidase/acylaminoacyl peptidase
MLNQKLWLALVALLAFSGREALAGRPLSLEDYYRLEDLGDPEISPDGRWVAFVRTVVIEAENRRNSEIWLVPADGSAAPTRLTHPSFSSSKPRWSPDGSLLAFESNRKAPGQTSASSVWFLRMDAARGEAFQIPGVEGMPVFSPDNRFMAFTKKTPPTTRREEKFASDFERRIHERFTGRMYDWMNFRFDQRGYLPDPRDPQASPPQELYLVPREGGPPRQLTRLGVDVEAAAWRPDSGALAIAADSHQRDEHTYERPDLWVVDLEGQARRLTDDGFENTDPVWSPDGQWIVFRRGQGLDQVIAARQNHGGPTDVCRIAAAGGAIENLTSDWDLIPRPPTLSKDGNFIYWSAEIGGNTHIFRVAARGGRVEQVTRGDRRLGRPSFSSDFRTLAYSASDPTHPNEIHAAASDGSGEKKLTGFNDTLAGELDLSRAERISFPSRDGTEIEGWMLPPPGYDPTKGPYPLILRIHGGPHSAYGNEFSYELQLLAGAGHLVLYTNPRGSTGYGEKFLWATWGGWGVKDYEDLMAGVDHVVKKYPIDEKRMGVSGGSYGGFMTNWVIGHTQRFAAAVSRASISNWVSDYGTADIPRTKESEFYGPPWRKESFDLMVRLSPLTYVANVTTPTLFLHGETDHRVPIEEAEQMYTALKKLNVPAKFVRYPDSYHGGWTPWNMVHRYHQELRWWEKYLGPARKETTS